MQYELGKEGEITLFYDTDESLVYLRLYSEYSGLYSKEYFTNDYTVEELREMLSNIISALPST